MHISDFDYELPQELIAREPVRPRDTSRMMVVNARDQQCLETVFARLPDLLTPSDVLVLNDTRVMRARLHGVVEPTGERPAIASDARPLSRRIEVLFANPLGDNLWEVMCRGGKRIRPGDRIVFGEGELEGIFAEPRDYGLRALQLSSSVHLQEYLERHGQIPLPPYLERDDTEEDAVEYQTVYARAPGAVAAPTAGLHFTPEILSELTARGVEVLKITLHVGVGTFIPVRTEDPGEHVLKPEKFEMSADVADRLNAARSEGRRIVAVGTTTTRTLEYLMAKHGRFLPESGETDLFILPGYQFRAVDALITNFHLPKSTLLMLVCAFASRPAIMKAYRQAIEKKYRFYSYGDCMLLVR